MQDQKKKTHASQPAHPAFIEAGKRLSCSRGFTLLEIVVVCIIIAILAAFAIPSYTIMITTARVTRASEEIRSLEKSIGAYQADRGILPDTLADLGNVVTIDPWGHPYQYLNIAKGTSTPAGLARYGGGVGHDLDSDSGYDLYSLGADGDSTRDIDFIGSPTASKDDIIRASDGAFVGLASAFVGL